MQDALTERMAEREHLLAQLEEQGYLTDPRLEEAMLAVPRHLFVPLELRAAAYEDRPLPIGFGQTVSAPHMVAMMSSALQLQEGQKVLEIGTGVGYHAAVVAKIVGPSGKVHSVEFLPELVELARRNLKSAKINVSVHEGDGALGWQKEAPFDAIYVTCAIPDVPLSLAQQLKDGGHFVAPVGVTRCQLMAGRKHDGMLELDDLGPCLFVNAQGDLGKQPSGDSRMVRLKDEDEEGDDDTDDGTDADGQGGLARPGNGPDDPSSPGRDAGAKSDRSGKSEKGKAKGKPRKKSE